ncbi:MAG: DUF11 domain-containing protein [Sedimentisphaerales bacterium]|nr:DUF11 domain-containing protein [Sedimentisphaerales bacterium]
MYYLETKVMYNQKSYFCVLNKILILLAIAISMTCIAGTTSAKSLYVLSDIRAYPNPLQAYDIAANGTLTFQAQYSIPRYNNGSIGLALDSDSGYLFVTYLNFNRIVLVNSKTMEPVSEMVAPPGSLGLEGIVYNHKKKQLYCIDRGRNRLWVYDWNSSTVKLTLVNGAPFKLQNASAYGIAIDETHQLLYVSNSTNRIYAYSTADWTLKRTITLNHIALCVAVDVKNNYLYSGGGYVGNPYLSQYNLETNTQLSTMVESSSDIGVMGIAVDPNTSKIYFTTGHEYIPEGDYIRVYDKLLHPVSSVQVNGNPTSLVIPIKEVGYNPLNLKKEVIEVVNSDDLTLSDDVKAGDLVTYRISFDNIKNENTVTNVKVVDKLPQEMSFVSASDDGVFGSYDGLSHTYTWNYTTLVKGSSAYLDIKVNVNDNVLPRTTITNIVTISSDSTPPVTRRAEIVTNSKPLNVEKTVFGAIEGMTKWVDINEVITYNIHIDNNENNFSATDVIVTDNLPEDLIFISADEDVYGVYDANLHTYTWSMPSIVPQEELDLGITVRLKEDTSEGLTVTNTVTVQSVETALSESSVDIKVGDGPVVLKSNSIQVIPGTVRRDSVLTGVMVVLDMPQGYKVKDIKNTPLLLSFIGDSEGGTVLANNDQVVMQSQDKTSVIAVFDKNKLMEAVSGYGLKYVEITGYLTDSGLFTGYATINITKW